MDKERVMVASVTLQQLDQATELLKKAVVNLEALKHGIAPALKKARTALEECRSAHACTHEMIRRIP